MLDDTQTMIDSDSHIQRLQDDSDLMSIHLDHHVRWDLWLFLFQLIIVVSLLDLADIVC